MITTRTCNLCGKEKPLTDFYRSHKLPLGREYKCKACRNPQLVANTARWRASVPIDSRQRRVRAGKEPTQRLAIRGNLEYAVIDGERFVKWWK